MQQLQKKKKKEEVLLHVQWFNKSSWIFYLMSTLGKMSLCLV